MPTTKATAVTWTWSDALRCGLCTLPAALIVLTGDPSRGLAWAVGILPAAVIGLAPQRKARIRLVTVGLLFGLSILLGSLLIQTTVTAILGIFAVALGSALLASRRAFGLPRGHVAVCATPVAAVGAELLLPTYGEGARPRPDRPRRLGVLLRRLAAVSPDASA